MSRRSGTSMQVLLATAIVGLFVYGLYSHHDIQTRLKKSEEKGERLRQQHDSLSAQLQVVYEHKSRLEKSLQSEKTDHRKSRTELLQQQSEGQTKFENEKQELLNRINSITQEHRMMKSQHEDLQVEVVKVKEDKQKLEEDHKKLAEQHNAEFQQMQQEKTNEIAQYRDQVVNLQRKNEDLENRMAVAVQNYQLNQAEIQRQKLLLEQQHQPQQQQGQQQQQQQQQNQQQQGLVQQQQQQNQQYQEQPKKQQQQQLQYQQQQLQQQGQQANFGANQMQQQQQPDQQNPHAQQEGQFNQGQQPNNNNNDLQYNQGHANVVNNRQIPQNVQSQFNQGNQGNQQSNQGNQQGNQGNQLGNLGVQDMAIQHQNMGLQQQPQANADQQQQQQQQQQIPQQQGLQQQQGGQQQQQQQQNFQTGGEGQKDTQDGQGQGQGQNEGGQDQAMQIKMPGDSQHPGYHEIKKPDPPQEGQLNVGQGRQEDSRGDAGRGPAQVDAEHKDVQFQQVAAPNMSPEKNQSLSNNTQQGRGLLHRLRRGVVSATDHADPRMKQRGQGHLEGPISHQGQIPDNGQGHALAVNAPDNGKDVKVVNNETGQNMVRTAVKSPQKEDQDKAMEEHDTNEDEAKLAGHKAEEGNQQNVPKIHRGGLNQANPLEDHFEGGMGGDGAGRDVIQAPVNPVLDGGEQGHGQVERPNVIPPMVNNNQENQVPLPQAPQLRDNEILKNGQQVNDDDDYDNGRNNDNKRQQDDQEDQEDDDNYPADKAKK